MSSARRGRRVDRAVVLASLAGITAMAWVLTAHLAGSMAVSAESMDIPPAAPSGMNLVLVAGMWAVMMVGMMVPSAAPMIVTYTDWTRRGPTGGSRPAAITLFVVGYLLVWLGFSLLAAILQVALGKGGLATAMGVTTAPALGGAVLMLAGLFQVTPWKQSCLRRCRTPVGFLVAEWRDGARGALLMGLRHGAYCLGCCWALMAVLFAVGTMHVLWMAAVAAFVLAEKTAPRALRLGHVAATALVGSGLVTLLASGRG